MLHTVELPIAAEVKECEVASAVEYAAKVSKYDQDLYHPTRDIRVSHFSYELLEKIDQVEQQVEVALECYHESSKAKSLQRYP